MCLISKRKEPHVLKRDRRCWKVLYYKDGKLISVYIGKEYELGKLYTEKDEPEVELFYWDESLYCVYGGYMHAFTSVKVAKRDHKLHSDMLNSDEGKSVICECTVPAGTEVYTNRKKREICARSLRIDKIISKT